MTLPGGYTGEEGSNGNNNPAWNEFLEVVPQELHGQVTPILEKWDKGVQERFTKVQSEYEPWKEFSGAGVDPETVRFGLNVLRSLEENPQMVYKAIGDYYKLNDAAKPGTEQGQTEPKPDDDPLSKYDSRFAEIERQNQLMAQVLIRQSEAKKEAEEDSRLDTELKSLRKEYGDYNEQFVLAQMQNGSSAKDAVETYFNWRDAEVKRHVPRPLIMGGNGGYVPGQHTDVKKLNESGTKNLVVQMLQAAQEQNRQ